MEKAEGDRKFEGKDIPDNQPILLTGLAKKLSLLSGSLALFYGSMALVRSCYRALWLSFFSCSLALLLS